MRFFFFSHYLMLTVSMHTTEYLIHSLYTYMFQYYVLTDEYMKPSKTRYNVLLFSGILSALGFSFSLTHTHTHTSYTHFACCMLSNISILFCPVPLISLSLSLSGFTGTGFLWWVTGDQVDWQLQVFCLVSLSFAIVMGILTVYLARSRNSLLQHVLSTTS